MGSFTVQRTSLVAQTVKRLPTMRETQVWSLGWEDPLEKEMATHSSTLAGKSHGWRKVDLFSLGCVASCISKIQIAKKTQEKLENLNKLSQKTFSSVQFSHSVMSNSLWPHEQQHARPPCPSPTPGVYPNPCPLGLKESDTTEWLHFALQKLISWLGICLFLLLFSCLWRLT